MKSDSYSGSCFCGAVELTVRSVFRPRLVACTPRFAALLI